MTDNTTVTITDYLDGFQYTNGALDFISFEGGYVQNTITAGENNYNYIFNYTDHLGNIRMNYSLDQRTNNLKIMEESHYYPFGLQHANYNNDLYEYRD